MYLTEAGESKYKSELSDPGFSTFLHFGSYNPEKSNVIMTSYPLSLMVSELISSSDSSVVLS